MLTSFLNIESNVSFEWKRVVYVKKFDHISTAGLVHMIKETHVLPIQSQFSSELNLIL